MVSAVEAETGTVFKFFQAAVTLWITLLEIGHKLLRVRFGQSLALDN